jgi:glucose-6-phosphate isomerase
LVPEILKLREEFRAQGLDRFVLCGMGGSSLAPEVITKNAKVALVVLDSTDPSQVRSAVRELERTVVVVSSKSGSTVETDSQKRAFEAAFTAAGIDPVTRIVIVTDPGSPLDKAAREAGYRVFNADPNVGGRYSALTAFGLVPSGLAGADIASLLASAKRADAELASDAMDNPALWLAACLVRTPAEIGFKDKFLVDSAELLGFGDWVEQLVAESTGKEDLGTLPVVVSASAPELAKPASDVLVTRFANRDTQSEDVTFFGELGELFLLWEYATAIAGYLLGINPFDQPNVESAKVAARELLDSPAEVSDPDFTDRGVAANAYGFDLTAQTVDSALEQLLSLANQSSYISIHAYLNREAYPQFEELRNLIAAKTSRPVTFGWGPRFLHSTGQYHKGGPKQGIFLQLTHEVENDLGIEGRPFSFGTLIAAQAAGDARVLEANGLPVLSLKLSNPLSDLELLKKAIA